MGILRTQRGSGVALVVLSAVVFSSAGIFTRGVSAEAWDVIFWRGFAAVLFTLAYLYWRGRIRLEWRSMGWPGVVVVLLSALGTAAFLSAFKLSTVANVALIYATAPFVSAALAWVFIGERPTRAVGFASLAVLLGVGLIAWDGLQQGTALGDFLAFVMTLMMSGVMVVYRAYPATPAALPAALSSVVLLPFGVLLGAPMAVQESELWVLVAFGLVFAVASVTLSEGARRLLAPVLALLVLSEMPRLAVIIGGAIILMAVLWAQATQAKES